MSPPGGVMGPGFHPALPLFRPQTRATAVPVSLAGRAVSITTGRGYLALAAPPGTTQGFVVTIEGCPISFGTAGLSGVTSSDLNWPSNVTLVQDTLVPPKVTWSETQHPLDGTIEVGAPALTLRERMSDGSVAAIPAGKRYIAWLATRKGISNVALYASVLATDTVIQVNDASRLPAAPCTVYLDQEAIRVGSYTGNQINVAGGLAGRGYLGTAAVAHTFNSDYGDRPFVFAEFPGFDRQRVILWRVGANNVATVMWIGYAQHAPAIVPSKSFEYKLQCEHFTKTDAMLPAGPPQATCRLRGVNMSAVGVGIKTGGHGFPAWDVPAGASHYPITTVFSTLNDALATAASNARTNVGGAGTVNGRMASLINGAASVTIITTGAPNVELHLAIGQSEAIATTTDGADPRLTTAASTTAPVTIVAASIADASPIPVDRVDGFPASWNSSLIPESDGSQTFITPMLLSEMSDEDLVYILPVSSTATDLTLSTGGPSVTGSVNFRARKPYTRPGRYLTTARGGTFYCIDKPLLMRMAARVVSNHWAYALRRGCVEDTATVRANLDSRQYDWSDIDRVVALTSDTISRREWYLDGSRTWGTLLSNSLKLGGCAPGIRNGRQSIVPMQAPMPTDPVAATINGSGANSNLVEGSIPEWGTFEDGLANAVHFKSDYIDLVTQDGASVAKYRQARMREIDLTQSIPEGSAADNPVSISQTIMRRYISTWGKPNRFVKLKLGPSWNGRLAHGDYVQLNGLFNVPDGNGGYGFTGVGQVFSREVSTKDDANVQYGFILYNVDRVAAISPCVRIGAIAGATVTVVIGYLSAVVTDYAGSNLSGYALPALDGGIGRFFVGDKVQMLERDTATPLLESLTIQSINYGTGAITFTTTPSGSWDAKIATGMVDLRFDHYSVSSPQADQKPWAWVGAESPSVIDSTSDFNQKFSP